MWKKICLFIFRLFGWKWVGSENTDVPKAIYAVVPHTSGWDFPIGLLSRGALQKDIKYIGKASLFRPPLGWIMYALGGYPVDRSKRTNFVDAVVDIFDSKESFYIAIAPEGTRKRVDKLKTGFYYIALGAKVPVILTAINYQKREVYFSKPFHPTGDLEKDFEEIDAFFRQGVGKKPEMGYLYDTH